MIQPPPQQTTRTTLQVLSIGLLIGGALWILQPFVPSILWATIIVVTTWPLFQNIQKRLWNRRPLAIAVMVGALLVIVIVPCAVAVGSIITNADKIQGWANSLRQMDLPPPPSFLGKIPAVGPRLTSAWQKAEALSSEELSQKLAPYTSALISWFIAKAGSVAVLFLHFIITVIIAIILYAQGEAAAATTRAFCFRLAGPRGEEVASLAAKAIRGVALGVVVTAFVQAALSGIGLAVSGVPSAMFLTAIIFVLCLCQIGPALVLLPAIVWLYWSGSIVSGTILVVFSVLVLPLDNLLRPILIRKGADIPLLLIFLGVIGGLVAMGVIGLFIGPVVLAVVDTLLKSWIRGDGIDQPSQQAARPDPVVTNIG
jgi:predicted PurR-regulated permease PerM